LLRNLIRKNFKIVRKIMVFIWYDADADPCGKLGRLIFFLWDTSEMSKTFCYNNRKEMHSLMITS
ncbi:hypothetical protein T11_5953, partial [Trichinella zimbabwensis]